MDMSQANVAIPINQHYLQGILTLPAKARLCVLFAHGSGSSRFSKRNQYVANSLNEANIATLLFDMLTPEEELADNETREYRFNIPLLTARLLAATDWLLEQTSLHDLALAYFGASTGGAAVLCAAAERPHDINAVVVRGGRPDLADLVLSQVQCPCLFIVGGCDEEVLALNQSAKQKLHGVSEMKIITGATHLFEEHGALEQVAEMAKQWFLQYADYAASQVSHLTRDE